MTVNIVRPAHIAEVTNLRREVRDLNEVIAEKTLELYLGGRRLCN